MSTILTTVNIQQIRHSTEKNEAMLVKYAIRKRIQLSPSKHLYLLPLRLRLSVTSVTAERKLPGV